MATGKLGGKALTAALRKLMDEQFGDTAFTNMEQITQLIVKQATGYTEQTTDERGNRVSKYHPPVAWCQQFIFERLEGKSHIAQADNEGGMKASDKVRELAKGRLNKLAAEKAGIPVSAPPSRPKKK